MVRFPLLGLVALAAALISPATATAATTPATVTPAAAGVPAFSHVDVVIEENHSYNEIIGKSSAPYINSLAGQGALFSQSFAVRHPSEPNYMAIFSGSTQGLTSDACPVNFGGDNLGNQLRTTSHSFTGYSESLPSDGYTGCTSGAYARKHSPWVSFTDLPASTNLKFSEFPTNFANLPTIAFVTPNLNDDMHDGTISQGDTWLKNNIDAYAQWAKANNSLLVVTWDEDDSSQSNQIPTLFVGAHVKPGHYSEHITHYTVLRTLEDAYGLAHLGNSASVSPITDTWQ